MNPLKSNEPNQPKVSIITPSYNQGEFLEETILSVLGQDYPNIEHIIIDGGSKDNSVDIIEKYQEHLAYWVSEPDRGQCHAINKGFARATGEILHWLNSDDLLAPGAVSQGVAALQAHPDVDVVYTDFDQLTQETGSIERYKVWAVDFPILLKDNCIPQPTAFFRSSLLDRIGPLDEELHIALDWEFWLRAARVGKLLYLPGKSWAVLRGHSAAKTTALTHKMGEDYLRVLDKFYQGADLPPEAQKVRREAYARAYWFMASGAIEQGRGFPEGARWLLRSFVSHLRPTWLRPLMTVRLTLAIAQDVGRRAISNIPNWMQKKRAD